MVLRRLSLLLSPHQIERSFKMRKEIYEELINLGYTPDEAWEMISEMEFEEDYE